MSEEESNVTVKRQKVQIAFSFVCPNMLTVIAQTENKSVDKENTMLKIKPSTRMFQARRKLCLIQPDFRKHKYQCGKRKTGCCKQGQQCAETYCVWIPFSWQLPRREPPDHLACSRHLLDSYPNIKKAALWYIADMRNPNKGTAIYDIACLIIHSVLMILLPTHRFASGDWVCRHQRYCYQPAKYQLSYLEQNLMNENARFIYVPSSQ